MIGRTRRSFRIFPSVLVALSLGLSGSLAAQGLYQEQQRTETRPRVTLGLELVVDGLDTPVALTCPPDDERIFVLEQYTGRIRIVDGGTLLPTPFLEVGPVSQANEQGLLGIAFHPDYATNGYFYITYTDLADVLVVSRFEVSAGDPNLADPASEVVLMTRGQPQNYHNGGTLHFGPLDGHLYIAMGEGGGGCIAQVPSIWLGKILRVDVSGPTPYSIPGDNPFVGVGDYLPEIWSYGWRNPWGFSFDRQTGDMYVGDVGKVMREEVNFEPALAGGRNYGWQVMEGSVCWPPDSCLPGSATCADGTITMPILEYTPRLVSPACAAVIGGVVYRGAAIPALQGAYLYGNHCGARFFSLRYDGAHVTDWKDRTLELNGDAQIPSLSAFAEDSDGEVLVLSRAGSIHRVVEVAPKEPIVVQVGPGFVFTPADIAIEIGDTVRWEWAGGFHNVESGVDGVHDGNFLSGPPTSSTDTVFELVFDQAFLDANPMPGAVYPYYCLPHVSLDMVGTVSVNVPQGPLIYGCDVNPMGSLMVLGGTTSVGSNLIVGLDNPLGTQPVGSATAIYYSSDPDPAFPCGTLVPGFGMAGAGADGELLITTPPDGVVNGPPWPGVGIPAPVIFPIPSRVSMIGENLYLQGAILDPGASMGVAVGLTEALRITITE